MNNKSTTKKSKTYQIDATTIEKLTEQFTPESQTIVHCSYMSKHQYINGGWVTIHPTTYLVYKNQKIQLLYAENIPVSPGIHVFSKPGELKRFTLVFPAIPKNWQTFHLIEKCDSSGAFIVRNINRNETGVYELLVD